MDNDKKDEKESTSVDVPRETPAEDDQSSPKQESNKPTDVNPQTSDTSEDSEEKAVQDGNDKKMDTIIDMLTSIINRLPDTGDSKEDPEPEKDNDNESDNNTDSLADFENLL